MRLLYIASSTGWGGGSVALYNVIRHLHEAGNIIRVLFPNDPRGRFCKELDKLAIKYYFANYDLSIYPSTKNPLKFIVELYRTIKERNVARKYVASLIKEFRPDIVHTNVGPLDIAADVCISLGVPHVWHLREYQDLDFNLNFFPSQQFFRKKIRRDGNYNIAITNDVFNYWGLMKDKDIVIYDGVFSKSVNIPTMKKENVILFVGRICEAKGLLEIIEPFARFASEYPQYNLVVAGPYSENNRYYKKCKRAAELNCITDKINYVGEVHDVYSIMAKAKAIVVPSRCEGFGFITAEAMLNSCFVIGRNTGGTKDQLDRCKSIAGEELGYRFVDNSSIYDGLVYVATECTDKKIQKAKKIVLDNYTIESHCESLINYYKYIIEKN